MHVEVSSELLLKLRKDIGDSITSVTFPNLEADGPRQSWWLCRHGNGVTCMKCAGLFQAAVG